MRKHKAFSFKIVREPGTIIERARLAASDNGVDFYGDEQEGRFQGQGIHGSYRIEGDQIAVMISRKPLILPWSVIETAMKRFFA